MISLCATTMCAARASPLSMSCARSSGEDVPYKDGLDADFPFRGHRVPFLSHMKGIYRAAAQRGPAALSINTSSASPYADEETPDGVLYALSHRRHQSC